jgi:cytochrome c-type biogenesis protein CcmH
MKTLAGLLLALLLSFAPSVSLAVNPGEVLADPGLEARARTISEGLRCLVCQNQSIDDSDADLAHDLRVLVRERLTAGDSDEAVVQYIVERYGEYVLLRPVLAGHTLLLWIAAPTLLLAGLVAVFIGARRKRSPTQAALTDEEVAALAALADDAER